MNKALHEEIIEEIGTQTLARFGLNIFSLDTYNAYGESVKMSNEARRSFSQHKNNDKAFGQHFEEFDSGLNNIKSALFDTGEMTYTTDTLYEIQKVQNIIKNGKKLKNPKDKAKFDFILTNYGEEVKNMDFNKPDIQALIQSDTREGSGKSLKNHTNTDQVSFDKNGNIIKKAQLKVIKNTNDLLDEKYLSNNDEIKVPFDDYVKHKENLEKMINDESLPQEKREKAKKALDMLHSNNLTNRIMCENPKTTAFITQSVAASAHIVQAGASDAIVVALSTLASGAVYEIKDALSGDSNISIAQRIKRLISQMIQKLQVVKGAFVRGAGFGAIDAVVGILGQIFQSIAGKLKAIWKSIRTAAKSIFNAICDYITGKISSFERLLSVIIKGFFSAGIIIVSVALETKLQAELSLLVTPLVAAFVAPALTIIIGSIAVVAMSKTVDLALETLFGVFAQAEIAKKRYEEIEALCEEMLPKIIEDRKKLEAMMKQEHFERKLKFETSFASYQKALLNKDNKQNFKYLNEICKLYGGELKKIENNEELKALLEDNKGKLKW